MGIQVVVITQAMAMRQMERQDTMVVLRAVVSKMEQGQGLFGSQKDHDLITIPTHLMPSHATGNGSEEQHPCHCKVDTSKRHDDKKPIETSLIVCPKNHKCPARETC